jgi:uncharacterized membrane protein YbhN (UPF0104 family)
VNRLTARRLKTVGRVVAAGLLVYLGARLWQLWNRQPVDFARADGGLFASAVAASVAAVVAYGLVWTAILRVLGVRAASPAWIGPFFQSQLAKYLPGSVWQYAGRVALVRERGVRLQDGVASVVVEILASAAAAGFVAALLLPWAATVAVWVVAAASVAALGRRSPRRLAVRGVELGRALRALPPAAGFYLPVWGLYGAAFWLTARALFAVPASDLPRYVGVFAAAWVVGFLVVLVPGGLGVREAVIAALLTGQLGEAHAIALAAASRLVLTAVDLGAGAVAVALPLRRREAA